MVSTGASAKREMDATMAMSSDFIGPVRQASQLPGRLPGEQDRALAAQPQVAVGVREGTGR